MITLEKLKNELKSNHINKKVVTAITGFTYFSFSFTPRDSLELKKEQLSSARDKFFLLTHIQENGIDKFSEFAKSIYEKILISQPINQYVFKVALGAKAIAEAYQSVETKKDVLSAIKITKSLLRKNINELQNAIAQNAPEQMNKFNNFCQFYKPLEKEPESSEELKNSAQDNNEILFQQN